MRNSADNFVEETRAIGAACADVLTRLGEAMDAQRRSILDLATLVQERSGGAATVAASPRPGAVRVMPTPPAPAAEAKADSQAQQGAGGSGPGNSSQPPAGEAATDTSPVTEELLSVAKKINDELLERAPWMALASLYQVAGTEMARAIQNAVQIQQSLAIVAQAVVTQGAAVIIANAARSAPPATTVRAEEGAA